MSQYNMRCSVHVCKCFADAGLLSKWWRDVLRARVGGEAAGLQELRAGGSHAANECLMRGVDEP